MNAVLHRVAGGAVALACFGGAASAQCSTITAHYDHTFEIEFSQPVECLVSSSYAGAGYTTLTFDPSDECGVETCLVPCAANDIVSSFDTQTDTDCTTYASASACSAYAEASTSSTRLYGRTWGTMSLSLICGHLSIPLFTIADPYILADPKSLDGVSYTITIGSLIDLELAGDQHTVVVLFAGQIFYVVYTLDGVRTSPGLTFDAMTGEWTATVTNVPAPGDGVLQPTMFTFDRNTFDIDDDGAFTQDDIDDIALLVGTPVGPNDPLGVYDVDGDEEIDADDVDILQDIFDAGLGSCVGDANGDQAVDLDDLNLVLAYFGSEVEDADSVGADVNDDGYVDLQDLNLVNGNFGAPCP
ncbi:MAG: hypothetical protein ACTS27_09395 [Phycisphaerales bacterium]